MEDRVPTKPGRVLITPENGSSAYYATVAMADEPTQVGTALNKQNLLTDPVATLIGLTAKAVPNDMMRVLATAGDLHVWRRTQQVSDKTPATYKLGPQESKSIYVAQPRQVSFSASVSVSDNGTISLVSPENITLTDNGGYISTLESSLRGKYATWDGLNGICFVPSSCSFSYASMFYTCSAVQMLIFVPAVPPGTYIDYPVSVNPNAYQTGSDAKPAGTTIEYLGKLGDKSRMQIVSYVGTGTYGASNPCSITADFPIESATFLGATMPTGDWHATDASQGTVNAVSSVYSQEYKKSLGFSSDNMGRNKTYGKISADKKTLKWYNLRTAQEQLNAASYTHYFLCLG